MVKMHTGCPPMLAIWFGRKAPPGLPKGRSFVRNYQRMKFCYPAFDLFLLSLHLFNLNQ